MIKMNYEDNIDRTELINLCTKQLQKSDCNKDLANIIRNYLILLKDQRLLSPPKQWFLNDPKVHANYVNYIKHLYNIAQPVDDGDYFYKDECIWEFSQFFDIRDPAIYYNYVNQIEEFLWNDLKKERLSHIKLI